MTIREYLAREARRIMDRALTEYTDADTGRRLIPERRRQYQHRLGAAGKFRRVTELGEYH